MIIGWLLSYSKKKKNKEVDGAKKKVATKQKPLTIQ